MTKIIKKHKFPLVITLAIFIVIGGLVFYFSGVQKARGAVQTLLLTNDLAFSIPPLQSFVFDETNATPSTDTTTDINTGNTANNRYFLITPGQINSTPFGTALPTNITTAGFRSPTLFKGDYANGNWTFKVKLKNRAAYDHSGKIWVRLWKATNADMTSPTAITSWFSSPNTIAFTATSGEIKTDVFTSNPGGPKLNNQWFYAEYVWQITAKANNSAAGFQFVVDESSGEEAILTSDFTSTVNPDATFYTNDTEAALNNLGARIASPLQQITVTGNQFKNGPCNGLDYKVSIGTYIIPCANVSNWQQGTITFTVPADINVYGGVGALVVTSAGIDDTTPLDFYVYPNIVSLTTPLGADAAREYNAADTDGIITINGTRFGAGGTVTILGQPVTTTVSYGDTSIQVQVPVAIADNLYQGSVVVTRTNPSDNRTDTYNSLRILPRITDIIPSSGVAGDSVTISGNHLCQLTGVCPTAGNRSTVSNNVKFATVQVADADVTGWSETAGGSTINVKVPAGTPVGNITVTVTSGGDVSNAFPFVILTPIPNDPTNPYQFKTNTDTAQPPTTNIAVGGGINQTNVWFRMTMSAVINTTLIPQVEVKAVGVAFDGTGIVDGAGVVYSGTPVLGFAQVTGLTNGTSYHWRARVKNQTTNDVSNWVSFGGNADPGDTDFYIDTTAPIISAVNATNIAGNSATIEWTTNESATQQVEYGISTCDPGAYFEPSSGAGSGTSHSITLLGLSSNTTYYYRVRSKDLAGNETISPTAPSCNSFLTSAPLVKAMKTLEFFAKQQATIITAPYTDPGTTFQIYISDSSPNIQSAFVEVSGVSSAGAGIDVKVNGAASVTGNLSANNVTAFNMIYNIPTPNTTLLVANENNPSPINTLYMNLTGTSNISLLNAKVVVTYYYSP